MCFYVVQWSGNGDVGHAAFTGLNIVQLFKTRWFYDYSVYDIVVGKTGMFVFSGCNLVLKMCTLGGGPKMAEGQDGETTFSPTNSLKDHLNAEQISQNNI